MPHEHRSDYFFWYREADWKIIYRFHTEAFELYNLVDDPDESEDQTAAQPERVLKMARAMAQELDGAWGDYGKLWPTHNPTEASKPDRPLEDDPFWIRFDVDGRDAIDSDGDGLTDAQEDLNADGLIDPTETNPDDSDSDGDNTDDYTEQRLGLDPRDSSSAFRGVLSQSSATQIQLTWPSQPGLTFSVLSSSDLSANPSSWPVLESEVEADSVASETQRLYTIDPENSPRQFFSVSLE